MKIQMKLAVVCAMATLLMGQVRAWAADEEPSDFTVNVLEAGTKKPVVNAQVNVRSGRTRLDGITGDDGAAKMMVGIAKATTISVTVKAEGMTSVSSYWNKQAAANGQPSDHMDIVLEKALPVSGRVLDQDGKPIAGAKVMMEVQKKYEGSNQRLAVDFTAVTTDEEGKWRFSGVPAQYDEMELGAADRDCLGENGYYPLEKFGDAAALRDGTAVLKLTRGTPVTIEVTDKDGNALPGAKVGYGEDRVASNVLPEEKTDGDGKLKLGIAPGVTAVLTVQSPGFAPELVRVVVGATEQTVPIKLEAGNLLEGTVLDEKGNPAARATVYIDTWRGARTLNKSLRTDAAGHFTWADAPADEVKADILMQRSEKRDVVLKAGADNNVALDAPTLFKGTVVDGVTGEPVTSFKIVEGIGFENQGMSWEPEQRPDPSYHADGGSFQVAFSYPYPRRAVRVIADGYLPCDSTEYTVGTKEVDFVFKLVKGEPVVGVVVNAEGKPLEKVKVVLVGLGQFLQVQNGRLDDRFEQRVTQVISGADGAFKLPPQRDDYKLVAIADEGCVVMTRDEFAASKTLKLQAWGRIEGVLRHGTKAWGGETVMASVYENRSGRVVYSGTVGNTTTIVAKTTTQPGGTATQPAAPLHMENPGQIYFSYSAKTGEDGSFTFDHMRAAEVMVGRQVQLGGRMTGTSSMTHVKVEGGQTAKVVIGGVGRPVMGRVVLPTEVEAAPHVYTFSTISSPMPKSKMTYPDEVLMLTPEQLQAWRTKWLASEEAMRIQTEQRDAIEKMTRINFAVNPDGSFRVDDVPEGTYTLSISITQPQGQNEGPWGKPLGSVYKIFEMPAVPGGVSDEPLDIGTLNMMPSPGKVGEIASDFFVTTVAGKEWKLSDQKGKYVLLYSFSPVWGNGGMAMVRKVWDQYGKDGRVVVMGLDFDTDEELAKRYAKLRDIPWDLAIYPRLMVIDRAPMSAYLVGPDGKVAGISSGPEKIDEMVTNVMKEAK